MQQVTVRVPASTSNLGPGFDCLGVALSLYNEVTIKSGAGAGGNRMIREAAKRFFTSLKCKPFPFSCEIRGNVPIGRGLGSSVTVRLGVLCGLNQLARANLRAVELFKLCAELEGHPDNAAPATFGGFTLARGTDVQHFNVSSSLHFILLIPPFEVATTQARQLLPLAVSHRQAVQNGRNVAAIVAAFASRDYKRLPGCFVDYLHQPFRKRLMPYLDRVITAAERAGALGAFLSGSGSAICAVALENQSKIARAMLRASQLPHAHTIVTRADNRGVRTVKSGMRKKRQVG